MKKMKSLMNSWEKKKSGQMKMKIRMPGGKYKQSEEEEMNASMNGRKNQAK